MKWQDIVEMYRDERSEMQTFEIVIKILVTTVWDMALEIEDLEKRIEHLEGKQKEADAGGN